MSEQILSETEKKMKKSVEAFEKEMSRIRTGRASPALLESIRVEYYGSEVPLQQVASVSVPEPRSITIQPWEKSLVQNIEKAILKSDLGITPKIDGHFIRLNFPPLTEERRRDLVKMVKKIAEDARIAVRNVRRDANEHIKREEKASEISEDESKKQQHKIQEFTDKFIKEIDKVLAGKEAEIMEGK
jgi:ribosome recycling factor